MKTLWKLTCRLTEHETLDRRRKCFLFLNCILSGVAGLLIWLIVRRFALDAPQWMFCFVGYPAVFHGFAGGVLYIMNADDRPEE